MKNKKQGFTLIELLVVVAIIGLLSTLSIIALNSARAKARDAKRLSDVKQMQVALELYYNDMADYPATTSITPGLPIYTDVAAPFLRAVPTPPSPKDGANCPDITSNGYIYTKQATSGAVSSYTIQFCLGSAVGGVTPNAVRTMTPGGIY